MATHYSTIGPICPYCDHQHYADEPFYFDGDMSRMDCERCERDFDVEVYTSTSWSSQVRATDEDDAGALDRQEARLAEGREA